MRRSCSGYIPNHVIEEHNLPRLHEVAGDFVGGHLCDQPVSFPLVYAVVCQCDLPGDDPNLLALKTC